MQKEEQKIQSVKTNGTEMSKETYEKALCALTEEVMKEPVEVGGYNYEKDEIIKFLKENMDIDPYGM